jgi:drug/metabolite transporter (DMT)-like permease
MALAIYVLCAATSLACAVLLYRGYRRTSARLLLWSTLCFAGFFLNNVLLIVDLQVLPDRDLSTLRTLPSLAGISFLVYGLIADSQ